MTGVRYRPAGGSERDKGAEGLYLSPHPAKCLPTTEKGGGAGMSASSQVNEAVARFPALRNQAPGYAGTLRWRFWGTLIWFFFGLFICFIAGAFMWQAFVIPVGGWLFYTVLFPKERRENQSGRWVFFHRQRREVAFTIPTTRGNNGPLRVEYCPWEEVVAFATSTELSGEQERVANKVFPQGARCKRNLFLYVCMPDPANKKKIKYSIVVGDQRTETKEKLFFNWLMQGWNVVRAFMENEPLLPFIDNDIDPDLDKTIFDDPTVTPAMLNERTLTHDYYLKNIKGKKSPNKYYDAGIPDFSNKAYKLQSEDLEKMNARLPDSFWEWAKPIPESEWKKPSAELTALNARLDKGFEMGKTFEEQMHEILTEQGIDPVKDFRKDKSVPLTPIQPKEEVA